MKALSLERFRALVEAYGADLSRFPAGERDAARLLVESSAEARNLLHAERALDAELAALGAPEVSATLERRLLEIPLRAPRARRWPFATVWLPALAWAAAAAVGVWLGAAFPDEVATLEEGRVDTSAKEEAVDVPVATPTLDDELFELASVTETDAWELP